MYKRQVLDDPWHPEFPGLLETDREEIESALRASPHRETWLQNGEDADLMQASMSSLDVESAALERWMDADATIALVAWAREHDPEGYARYLELRSCESSPP